MSIKGSPDNIARLLSLLSLGVASVTLFLTVLKGPSLTYHPGPVSFYAAPRNGTNLELFEIPITIVNTGARPAVITFVELAVRHAAQTRSRTFHAQLFGRIRDAGSASNADGRSLGGSAFAPIFVAGNASRTEVLVFTARPREEDLQKIVTSKGCYRLAFKFGVSINDGVADQPLQITRAMPHYEPGEKLIPLMVPELTQEKCS